MNVSDDKQFEVALKMNVENFNETYVQQLILLNATYT